VDNVRLPAGDYVISSPSERVVMIQHVRYGSSTNSDGRAKLVFHKYGNAYFLASAWLPNSPHAREFFESSREIQLARNGGQDVVELSLLAKK
jgi:hypothetical protein